jgi:subtilisin family serine protease
MRTRGVLTALAWLALVGAAPAGAARPVTIGYTDAAALRGLHVVLRLAPLHVAEVTGDPAALRLRPGIRWVQRPVARTHEGRPRLEHLQRASAAAEWEFAADRENLVPDAVEQAASAVTVAVVDTGADLSAPDLAGKSPVTYNVVTGDTTVDDQIGHGTFVASLAAGVAADGQGVEGFGGDDGLMVVQANRTANTFTDVDEAAGIVWAVDHGAKIVNLSIGGTSTSQVEKDAINYAISHGVLLVAAAGNSGATGNEPSYPAALLGSHGLAVAASTPAGGHASFSTSAPYVSIAAPGVRVLGATSPTASTAAFPRASLGAPGTYAFGTGTSYSAPQVAGAAALVWAANPTLTADGVIQVLEQTARGTGAWSPQLGWGVLDVAAAVADASGVPLPPAPLPPVVTKTAAPTKTKHVERVSLKSSSKSSR